MSKKNAVSSSMLGIALLFGSLVYAQMKPPVENINPRRHPNLAAAQRLCDQAFEKIQAAQGANEFDLDGHAAKAKELLDQASRELKQAARNANKEHKER
jgi:F0F1-type ATP synthase membrane subunit b/b'